MLPRLSRLTPRITRRTVQQTVSFRVVSSHPATAEPAQGHFATVRFTRDFDRVQVRAEKSAAT
jgi:hypothetical protein